MASRVMLALCLIASVVSIAPSTTSAQSANCADYDAWVWAQTVYDRDPDAAQALDPDGNGIACEQLPVVSAFAPALWADAIPAGAEPVQVTSITDGDTFGIIDASGQPDTVRMYHIDAPETTNFGGGPHCGGDSATAHLSLLLGYAPGGTVYLEYDVTQRDRYDRRLAYVWYELGGDVYFINEAMVRDGYAESETYKPDTKYQEQLNNAEQWSVQKVTGVRLECGRFGRPPGSSPSDDQIAQAWREQPNQGQLPQHPRDRAAQTLPTQVPATGTQVATQPSATDTEAPWVPTEGAAEPPYVPPTQPPAPGGCDPNYTPCVPLVNYDLDCADIGHSVTVVGGDPHNFDGDYDGRGCESW